MGRKSFAQELKALAQQAGEGIDAGGCWWEVLHPYRELGRNEKALGRAGWTVRSRGRDERASRHTSPRCDPTLPGGVTRYLPPAPLAGLDWL